MAIEFQIAQAEPAHPPAAGEPGTLVEHPEAAHKEPFPPFDPTHFASQLLWFAITFVALYLILAKVAIPQIGAILGVRRGRIAGDLADAEAARKAAGEASLAYDKALAEARAGASAIAGKARDAARAAADAERARSEADLGKRLAVAEARIAEIKERALADVGAIAGEATGAIVAALVEAKVTAGEIDTAVGAAMAGRNAGGN